MEVHSIEPVYDSHSRILILGSFPSVRSRQSRFFYGHPQNRFWKVLAGLYACPVPETTEEKKRFLLEHGIALWDVIESCTITGSSDASIRDVKCNDLSRILETADIRRIYTNGAKADQLYRRFLQPETGLRAVRLPSTSPANASCSLERLKEDWKVILETNPA